MKTPSAFAWIAPRILLTRLSRSNRSPRDVGCSSVSHAFPIAATAPTSKLALTTGASLCGRFELLDPAIGDRVDPDQLNYALGCCRTCLLYLAIEAAEKGGVA